MYHNLPIPDQCLALWEQCHALVAGLLENSNIEAKERVITSRNPLDPQSDSLYLVTEGNISEVYEEQIIVIYEEGDLIGADGLQQKKSTTYINDFAVKVLEYDGKEFLQEVFNDKTKFSTWSQYLSCLSQSYQLLMCHFSQQDISFSPEFRHYDKGDVIIEENTEGDEVFTLITGSAKVMLNDIEVGEINKDEIFGAIAALTNTRRNASIIATDHCDTIVVKSDSFRGLLAARPDTVQKLVNDMARTIVSCNERILELSPNED
jgi:CRP-like cAMP-binding protein